MYPYYHEGQVIRCNKSLYTCDLVNWYGSTIDHNRLHALSQKIVTKYRAAYLQ